MPRLSSSSGFRGRVSGEPFIFLMDSLGTRPHPNPDQTGTPLQAKPCGCDEPVGDPRELTCIRCGRQIGGVPLPARGVAIRIEPSGVRPATKRRTYRAAP